VLERRNSPSIILWGIQNESMLPADFTNELKLLIRTLDDTSPVQRKVVTCNGGFGSDWNVPQNWSGTYGRSVEGYAEEIIEQGMAGEYGQYRVLGKHEEGNMEEKQNQGGDVSEELFCYSLGTKIREAEKVRNQIYGHYQWIFATHANPGRETMFCLDGFGPDGIGVVNSKGLISAWGEPVDAYYMYRSYYTSAEKEAMVYIVSHTWTDRFKEGPVRADITVYSNCDKVELMNDYGADSYGVLNKQEKGIPFIFRDVMIKNSVLYAQGYQNGKIVAQDCILLDGLKEPLHYKDIFKSAQSHISSGNGYLFRVNCGGGDFTDHQGNLWTGDRKYSGKDFGYKTWAMEYDDVEDELGCIRRIHEPVKNAVDQTLFQTFRYGREKLAYYFHVDPGMYQVELYFIEPWYGVGGGMDCTAWRVFDVAINDCVAIQDLDIWSEAGTQNVIRKDLNVKVEEGIIKIHFPRVKSYQAVISAIAVRKVENE